MKTYAHFISKYTKDGFKIFRHSTEFHSVNGPGKAIGLIVMMNPGAARPEDDSIFGLLQNSEFETVEPILTKPDNTMKKVMRLIELAYEQDYYRLPEKFTVHIDNIFNLREKDSDRAKKIARNMTDFKDVMFKKREYTANYEFVFFAWGKLEVAEDDQNELRRIFPKAIIVNKSNIRGDIREVEYPVPPLYMKTEFFLEASKGKIKINEQNK